MKVLGTSCRGRLCNPKVEFDPELKRDKIILHIKKAVSQLEPPIDATKGDGKYFTLNAGLANIVQNHLESCTRRGYTFWGGNFSEVVTDACQKLDPKETWFKRYSKNAWFRKYSKNSTAIYSKDPNTDMQTPWLTDAYHLLRFTSIDSIIKDGKVDYHKSPRDYVKNYDERLKIAFEFL